MTVVSRWAAHALGLVLMLVSSGALVACGDDGGGGDGGDVPADGSTQDDGGSGSGGSGGAGGSGGSGGSSGSGGDGGDRDAGDDAAVNEDAGAVDPGESAFSGEKDLTFGTNGVFDTGVDSADLIGVAAVPGDKLLFFTGDPALGTTSRRVYRFDYEGVLDASYGSAGFATVPINDISSRPFGGEPFTVDAMGRAYYIESRASFEGTGFISAVYIKRLDTSGMPDASFGTAGTFTLLPSALTGLTVASVSAAAIQVLADGSMVLGGFVQTTQSDTDGAGRQWAVIKLHDDGSLDTAFNDTGYVLIDSQRVDSIHLLHVAEDGSIYAVGKKRDEDATFVALKIAEDGTRDDAYGDDGEAVIATSDDSLINRIATDAEGRLVAVGRRMGGNVLTAQAAYATRLTTAGVVDDGFGDEGVVMVDFIAPPANGQIWNDMFNRILFDGRSLFLTGFTQSQISNQDEQFTIARLADDGSLVEGFPFTESLGGIFGVTYPAQITEYAVTGSSLVIVPTPDGEQLVGIGVNDASDFVFVRWD